MLPPEHSEDHNDHGNDLKGNQRDGKDGIGDLDLQIVEQPWIEKEEQSVSNAAYQRRNRRGANEVRQLFMAVQLQQPKKQDPLRCFSHLDLGLHCKVEPRSGEWDLQIPKEEFDERSEGKNRHPEEQQLITVAQPGNQAKQRDQGVQQREGEGELLPAQKSIIEGGSGRGNRVWTADLGNRGEAAEVSGRVRRLREAPDADGKDAVAGWAQVNYLCRAANDRPQLGRRVTQVAHLHTIPVDLVHVPQATNEQVEIRRCTRGGCDRESAAIPGVAGVRGVALAAPGLIDGNLFPTLIVERWIGPCWIVSDVELPGSIQRSQALPKLVDDQGVPAGLRRCVP